MNKKRVLGILVTAAVVAAGLFYFWRPSFDAERLVKNSELGNRSFSRPVVEVVSPKYGIKAYLLEDTSNPIISVGFVFAHAGAGAEKEGQAGLAKMTAALISEAAGELDSQAFKEKLEDYAISIGYGADNDDFSGRLLTIKEFSPLAFAMLKQTLTEPRVDRADLERIRKQMLAMLESQNENPGQQLSLTANRTLFGDHPYGRNPLGKKEDIESFTSRDIKQFAAANLGRSNLIVGIAGDMTAEEAGVFLDEVFGLLPKKGAADNVPAVRPELAGGFVYQNEELPQSMAFVAAQGTRRNEADFYPLYIANYILGGSGLGSRLNLAAREKEGLTYGIYTGLSIADKAEMIVGGFSSTPENFARVVEIFTEKWNEIGQQGVSEKELAEAKNYLVASYNLRFADIAAIADMLVYMQKENLGIDFLLERNRYVSEVTLEQVNRAAAQYFTPENLKIIGLGRFN